MLDSTWPGAPRVDPTTLTDTALLISLVAHLAQTTAGQRVQPAPGATNGNASEPSDHEAAHYVMIEALSPRAQIDWLKAQLEQLQILPVGSDPAWARGLFTVYKNNLQTDAIYFPTAVIPLPITLFAAQEQPAGGEQLSIAELVKGWSQFGAIEVEVVGGNHFSMLTATHVQQLAAQLTHKLRG